MHEEYTMAQELAVLNKWDCIYRVKYTLVLFTAL